MIHITKARRLAVLLLAGTFLLASCGITPPAAATMHLKRSEGTVGVSDGAGKDIEPRDDLGLYSGYGVLTRRESYAWIDLDEVKLTKLDEKSEIAITKVDKNLEIEVLSGSLFFNVTEPLAEDETMTIRSATMAVGIRGTCGWVSLEDDEHLTLYLLEGKAECSAGDKTAAVTAGEAARMFAEGEITVFSFAEEDIPDFVMDELDEEALEEARSFLAPGIPQAAREALESIAYYGGDPAGCTMTPEQAAAFLQVIRDNMAELDAMQENYTDEWLQGMWGTSMGTIADHPNTAAAALFDLGDGTPALIFGGALIQRTDNGVYHWLTSGRRGIWLYQNGAAVQYAPDRGKQALFDGYLLTGGVYEGDGAALYEVYPIEGGTIAGQSTTTAAVDYASLAPVSYLYLIDGAEVSKDAFGAWVDRWVHAEPNPNFAELPWGRAQSSAGFASSTDVGWSSWGMSPIEDVIAALEILAGETEPVGPVGNSPLPLINFSYQTSGGREYASITAFSQDGAALWEYTTPQLEIAQLERVADIGLAGDGYCFVFDGSVVCLDARTGTERWNNSDFGGAGARSVTGSGVIYLCGSFGPDLFAVSFSGETVKRIDSLDDNYYWPYQLELSGDILTVSMDGGPEGDLDTGHPIRVNVTDWSVESN